LGTFPPVHQLSENGRHVTFFFLTELEGLRPYRNFIKNKEETEGTKVLPPGLGNKKRKKERK